MLLLLSLLVGFAADAADAADANNKARPPKNTIIIHSLGQKDVRGGRGPNPETVYKELRSKLDSTCVNQPKLGKLVCSTQIQDVDCHWDRAKRSLNNTVCNYKLNGREERLTGPAAYFLAGYVMNIYPKMEPSNAMGGKTGFDTAYDINCSETTTKVRRGARGIEERASARRRPTGSNTHYSCKTGKSSHRVSGRESFQRECLGKDYEMYVTMKEEYDRNFDRTDGACVDFRGAEACVPAGEIQYDEFQERLAQCVADFKKKRDPHRPGGWTYDSSGNRVGAQGGGTKKSIDANLEEGEDD